ncbi:MAG: peptidase M61 [Caulobacteraceae bacterium]|nr:peptidase M61 [Caulobacteraceae bacterium]
MKSSSRLSAASAAAALAFAFGPPAAAQSLPQPATPAPAIAAPQDLPYPGALQLSVDATDLTHGIFAVRERVPIQAAGPITLLYPKWLPGNHSPTGPIDKLAGLTITANGQPVAWRRDPVDVYAFHVDAPAGASALDLVFQFLSPVSAREGRVVMTPAMLNVEWNAVVLYPAGYFARQIPVEASVRLPDGFSYATALETASAADGSASFKPTPLDTLVDSPLIAGRNFKRFELDPGGPERVSLDVIADRPDELAATPDQIAAHKALVQQAYRLFGSHHYGHYDFLLSLSDKMGGAGLEHHQSSEDGTTPRYFIDWDKTVAGRDLLAHEFTHSWNGKFRRPADLWTPNFNVPMRDGLLWVYEGQTQYWGYVLAARSGLMTRQETLDAIAETAATYDHRVGRSWRPLEDTTNDPIIAMRRPLSWLSWQRSEDYYSEGQLVWLDADTLIRQLSGGRRSLDDFARGFFGVHDGSLVTDTYTFDEVVAALNAVQPYDWAGFLRQRLEGHGPGAPLDGLARGGYRLVYTDVETDFMKSAEGFRGGTDLLFSIGANVGKDGVLGQVLWDGPAFKAGLTEGTQIVAVNGDAYDPDGLKDAIKAARTSAAPIALLVKDKNQYRTVTVDYHDGLRYPHLERIADQPARLDDILAAKR